MIVNQQGLIKENLRQNASSNGKILIFHTWGGGKYSSIVRNTTEYNTIM